VSIMCRNRIRKQVQSLVELAMGLFLVFTGETAVSGHIRIEDCRELSFHRAMLSQPGLLPAEWPYPYVWHEVK
jgi:hypothetical protein